MNETSARADERAKGRGAGPQAAGQQKAPLLIELSYGRLRAVLWAITIGIIAMGIFRELFVGAYDIRTGPASLMMIALDSENSVGEWWGTLQLVLGAVLLAVNGKAEPDLRWKRHWFVLAAIFVFLSIDESAGLHEMFVWLLAPYHFTGVLRLSWIIPYGIACILLGLIYVPFVLALPDRLRWLVALSGALFLASAIGFESLQAVCASTGRTWCWLPSIITEESGEMISLTIFILALVAILRTRFHAVKLSLQS